jgi:ADP-ribose pyrophosphatase
MFKDKPTHTPGHQAQVELIEDTVVYQGFFRLRRVRLRHTLFAGGWSAVMVRELLERGHAVAVLPYDPIRDKVVLVEQFRVGALETGAWLLEIVAGMIEADEAPAEVARREAQEEAGCTLLDLLPLYEYYVSPGGTSERIMLFCARVDAAGLGGIHGLAAEHEDIRVRVLDCDAALALLDAGQIRSATPIIALQWLAQNRTRLRRQWALTQ